MCVFPSLVCLKSTHLACVPGQGLRGRREKVTGHKCPLPPQPSPQPLTWLGAGPGPGSGAGPCLLSLDFSGGQGLSLPLGLHPASEFCTNSGICAGWGGPRRTTASPEKRAGQRGLGGHPCSDPRGPGLSRTCAGWEPQTLAPAGAWGRTARRRAAPGQQVAHVPFRGAGAGGSRNKKPPEVPGWPGPSGSAGSGEREAAAAGCAAWAPGPKPGPGLVPHRSRPQGGRGASCRPNPRLGIRGPHGRRQDRVLCHSSGPLALTGCWRTQRAHSAVCAPFCPRPVPGRQGSDRRSLTPGSCRSKEESYAKEQR